MPLGWGKGCVAPGLPQADMADWESVCLVEQDMWPVRAGSSLVSVCLRAVSLSSVWCPWAVSMWPVCRCVTWGLCVVHVSVICISVSCVIWALCGICVSVWYRALYGVCLCVMWYV